MEAQIKIHTCKRRTRKLHTERSQPGFEPMRRLWFESQPGFEPKPCHCEVKVLTPTSPAAITWQELVRKLVRKKKAGKFLQF